LKIEGKKKSVPDDSPKEEGDDQQIVAAPAGLEATRSQDGYEVKQKRLYVFNNSILSSNGLVSFEFNRQ